MILLHLMVLLICFSALIIEGHRGPSDARVWTLVALLLGAAYAALNVATRYWQ